MFCSQCGQKLDESAKFCPGCGTKVTAAEKVISEQNEQNDTKNEYEEAIAAEKLDFDENEADEDIQYGNCDEDDEDDEMDEEFLKKNAPHRGVSFGEAIKLFFANAFNFEGRASRSEYWMITLFNELISILYLIINSGIKNGAFDDFFSSYKAAEMFGIVFSGIYWVFVIAMLIPTFALIVRRIHDIGKPGYALLVACIPLIGVIVLFIFFCTDSAGDNQWGYGPDHK